MGDFLLLKMDFRTFGWEISAYNWELFHRISFFIHFHRTFFSFFLSLVLFGNKSKFTLNKGGGEKIDKQIEEIPAKILGLVKGWMVRTAVEKQRR